jgi:para-aminobenzoate synthetase/4-amino-4-deoxychorismate lyase
VKVPRLFEVEHYPTVLQMTSTVVSELQTGLGAIDLLQTIYPCGSITGAPKIAAMQRIHELEDSDRCPRGPYTGSIGHVLANGDSEFNVAIRTLVIANGAQTARYNVGSGIVIDSGPVPEWRECLQKAAFVASTTDFQLIETFALGPSRFSRAALHLDRLEGSAHRLGFAFDRSKLESELDRIRERLHAAVRLRILLERAGCFHVENAPLPVPPRGGARVSIAPRPVSADDFRLAHKTSDRAFYDLAREACGTFEVLFTDEEGFLTEGSFTNLFVHDGQRFLTPPLRRGLLPGILRQELIKKGAAVERDLKVDDLRGGFWIGNSLRGLIPAALPLATVADG